MLLVAAARKCRRLSREVLCYEQPRAPPQKDRGGSTKHVRILDGALPPDMFAMMQSAFAPSAPFWREHAYHDPATGYFSYVHALGGGAPRSGLDQVIRHIHALVCRKQPQAKQACFAEWWAHCRPHSSGHQLHFDSDNEGQGTVRNPILSSVIYLHEDESVGGPTLMTNQRLGARLADRGWLVFPRANRLVSFDGAVLHGVVPGRSGGGGNAAGGAAGARRVTFMVAFWRAIRTRPSPDGRPGPSQPFPYKAAAAAAGRTWQRPLLPVREGWGEDAAAAAAAAAPRVVLPFPLRRVWEAVGEEMTPVEALSGPPHYNLCFQGF
ncbi:hypothetical protein JKP88DRAFT_201455 [Tribonema minus]|uniref:Uncharacterized protein n=1 Tax=Tribonema minus TaxID=303371 RepID=A0A835YQH3_9STRA|nr:hypothetical protein JKP88DRAFT_201455 [Tribonema minus]